MSDYFLTAKVQLACFHGGTVVIKPQDSQILVVDKDPVLTEDATFTVTPGTCSANPTCTALTWSKKASSVKVNGTSILLQSTPTGDADAQPVPTGNGQPKVVSGVQTIASGV